MKWYESIAFKTIAFVIVSTIAVIVAVSYSVNAAVKDEIAESVEKQLILEGDYLAKLLLKYLREKKSDKQLRNLLRRIANKNGGYIFLEDNKGNLLLASHSLIEREWESVYKNIKPLGKPHPYKERIRFQRFTLQNDPFFGERSSGIIFDMVAEREYRIGMAIPYAKAFASVERILRKIFIVTITVVVFLALIGYYILRREIVLPLKDIMEQLHLDQNFDIDSLDTVQTAQKGEIGELVEAINRRTQTIKALAKEIEDTQKEIVFTMGAIGESRSKETGNHVKRVAEYSKILALGMGMSEREANLLKEASPMHDIGKVAIPDSILNKPGLLTEDERKIMNTHAELGYEMLKHSRRELLQAAAIVAYEHHEKWDGSGYPRGLRGEEIHIYGRITAVADVFDALGSDRVYKKAWDDEQIFEFFKEEKGRHFDPKLVDLFFENIDAILEVRKRFADV